MSELTLDSLLESLDTPQKDDTIEKQASEAAPSVADELRNTLTKEASDASTLGETNMSDTGNAIADKILASLAGMDKQASNDVKEDLDQMESEHDKAIVPTPRQGKTVTEVARAIQTNTPAGSGADSVKEENEAATEGNAGTAVSAIPSDIEKMAAVQELMDDGLTFAEASDLVKQASAQLEAEQSNLEKAAAVSELVAQGIDFSEACDLVKQASEDQVEEYSDLEKAAAVQELMVEDGLSFDEATDLVKQAALGK